MAKSNRRGRTKVADALEEEVCIGPPWTWFCRVNDRGVDVIDRWVNKELSIVAQANLDRAKDHLAAQPLARWSRPNASPLGKHIYVIRFIDEARKQWRVFGHAVPIEGRFVMTITAFEKDNVYHPENAGELASEHKRKVSAAFSRYAKQCD